MAKNIIISNLNTAPAMTDVWVFVSRDKDGQENVVGSTFAAMGQQPMMTGNPKILKLFKKHMEEARDQLKKSKADQSIHLLHFSNREEIEW